MGDMGMKYWDEFRSREGFEYRGYPIGVEIYRLVYIDVINEIADHMQFAACVCPSNIYKLHNHFQIDDGNSYDLPEEVIAAAKRFDPDRFIEINFDEDTQLWHCFFDYNECDSELKAFLGAL
jgi:hypothetical protein